MDELINIKITEQRRERFKNSTQLSLRDAIEILKRSSLKYVAFDGEVMPKHVQFDFGYMRPTGLDSWRGAYEELAISYGEGYEVKEVTVEEFLDWLKNACWRTYQGYKGGEFTMNDNTPLWVANYGHANETALVDIEVREYDVILRTEHMEY